MPRKDLNDANLNDSDKNEKEVNGMNAKTVKATPKDPEPAKEQKAPETTKTPTPKATPKPKEARKAKKLIYGPEYKIVRTAKNQNFTPEALKVVENPDFEKLLVTRDRFGVLRYSVYKYQKQEPGK